MQEAALRFFDDRERQVYAGYRKQASGWSRAAGAEETQPFWGSRGEFGEPAGPAQADQARVQAALLDMRAKSSICLRRGDGVRTAQRAGIAGSEVVLRDALAGPGGGEALDYVANVEVCRLVEMAPHHRQVPDLFEAYNRAAAPVDLPHFLAALSTLLAESILVSV
jgi:hypothetical protein